MTWQPSRPSRAEREPQLVAESLGRLSRSLGAPDPGVVAFVFAHWEELVGPEVAAHATPVSLRDGVLVISVDQPAWATQLRYLTGDLLARLSEQTAGDQVREVRVQVAGAGAKRPR